MHIVTHTEPGMGLQLKGFSMGYKVLSLGLSSFSFLLLLLISRI